MATSRATAILKQRCPICLEGKVFHGFIGTHRNCPHCGIQFERETGYFLTAMFFAYAIGFVLIAPTALYLYIRGVSTAAFLTIISGALILLWPLIFRYSRILWLHADQLMDPRQEPPFGPSVGGRNES